jgi:hypothetical protein
MYKGLKKVSVLNINKEDVIMKQLLIFMVISVFVFLFPSASICKPLFNPVEITPPDFNFYPNDFEINGNYMFVAGWSTGIHIFDISDFDNPRWVKRIETEDEISSIAIKDGYLYAATVGLDIYDIRSIETIQKVKSLESENFYRNIEIDGNHLFINSPDEEPSLKIFDIFDPDNPRIIKEVSAGG